MLLQLVPLFVLTCHCTVGAGSPLAEAVNVTVAPVQLVTFDGWLVIDGGGPSVKTAGLLVTDPQLFVNTARNW